MECESKVQQKCCGLLCTLLGGQRQVSVVPAAPQKMHRHSLPRGKVVPNAAIMSVSNMLSYNSQERAIVQSTLSILLEASAMASPQRYDWVRTLAALLLVTHGYIETLNKLCR